jgi:hypothetical protein
MLTSSAAKKSEVSSTSARHSASHTFAVVATREKTRRSLRNHGCLLSTYFIKHHLSRGIQLLQQVEVPNITGQ